jgi:hypothetical protein
MPHDISRDRIHEDVPVPHHCGIADVCCYGYSSRHRIGCCASKSVLPQPWAGTLDGSAASHKIPHNHQAQMSGLGEIALCRWTDSDRGADVDCRHSISGYVFSLRGGAITWSSKKQPTVATSSTEGKYMVSCHTTKECLWLWTLLKLISFAQTDPTTIYCNNESTITLTRDPSFHAHMKHIDIQHHFAHKHIQSCNIKFTHLPTCKMLADSLTKALTHPQFEYLIKKLGVLDPSDRLTT